MSDKISWWDKDYVILRGDFKHLKVWNHTFDALCVWYDQKGTPTHAWWLKKDQEGKIEFAVGEPWECSEHRTNSSLSNEEFKEVKRLVRKTFNDPIRRFFKRVDNVGTRTEKGDE